MIRTEHSSPHQQRLDLLNPTAISIFFWRKPVSAVRVMVKRATYVRKVLSFEDI